MEKPEVLGRHVLVWGLGLTGLACARFVAKQGARVSILEGSAATRHQEAIAALSAWPISYTWEKDAPTSWEGIDLVLLSPGVPYDLPALEEARARGIEVATEIDWAARWLDLPIVAVTGSAGKSTTVSLLGAMLEASGLQVFVGGNLGVPLISLVEEGRAVDRLVLECSSFQLEASQTLTPDIAVLTNLQPNHLDRHKTMERYAWCKGRLFSRMSSKQIAILRANDPLAASVLAECTATRSFFWPEESEEKKSSEALQKDGDEEALPKDGESGHSRRGAWLEGGELVLCDPSFGEEHYSLRSFRLRGRHNRENLMAAALAARLSGATAAGIAEAMERFGGLAHRTQEAGTIGGVRYINDSKATTPDSAARAIEALAEGGEPLHLLLGGRSKGTGFRDLYAPVAAYSKAVYLFGEAAEEIARDIEGAAAIGIFATMEDALEAASQAAKTGEIVLLSPACTSYDAFRSFVQRGERFLSWVQARQERDVG